MSHSRTGKSTGASERERGLQGSGSPALGSEVRRRAFTLVELLVVMAVIGLLISILLPAVQAAREAARRLQCASNLRQLSLAVMNYENGLRILPAAGIVDIANYQFKCRSGTMFSWAVLILPYMEQGTLHERFDFNVSILEQRGGPQAAQFPLMLCPTDGAIGRRFVDSDLTAGRPFGKGNYAAYCSTYHVDLQETPPGQWPYAFPGAIVNHGKRLSEVTDGLSNTVVLSEVRTRDREDDQRGAWALPWAGASLLAIDRHSFGASEFDPDDFTKGLSQTPNCQGPIFDMLYKCSDQEGSQWEEMPCATWSPGYPNGFISAAPRSLHPGGVNAAMMDGRVKFLPDNIDEIVMAMMVCICDNRKIDVEGIAR